MNPRFSIAVSVVCSSARPLYVCIYGLCVDRSNSMLSQFTHHAIV